MKPNDRAIIEITATFFGMMAVCAVFQYFHVTNANQVIIVLAASTVILGV